MVLVLLAGCDNKSDGGPTASAKPPAPSAAPTPTSEASAPTTEAKAPAVTPTDKEPFDSLMFKAKTDKDSNGWPIFEVINAGKKTVAFANVYGFAYDKDGKFVAMTKPLSWNPGKLMPGAKVEGDLEIGDREAAKVADTATQFEICYDSIKFDGEPNAVTGKRCDQNRPLGGAKTP